jgi:hypothetical protein
MRKNMKDITNSARFQRILIEAAQYRVLRDIFEATERRLERATEDARGAGDIRDSIVSATITG